MDGPNTDADWLSWDELPWWAEVAGSAPALAVAERLLQAAVPLCDASQFLQTALTTIATEFSVQWAAVLERTPDWQTRSECGRLPGGTLPWALLADGLDRDAGAVTNLEQPAGWSLAVAPLPVAFTPEPGTTVSVDNTRWPAVLVLAGRNLQRDALPAVVALARMLGHCRQLVTARQQQQQHALRLQTTLEVASSFVKERKSERLLRMIAVEATRLLDCDRASIFVRDPSKKELVALPALGVEGESLRIADDIGIAGDVVQTGRAIRLVDVYADDRFDQTTDTLTGYRTRSMVCVPMCDADGNVLGAFEAINKRDGGFTDDDEDALVQLAGPAASAIVNSREWEQLQRSRELLAVQLQQRVQLIGHSPAADALRSTVEKLAGTELPVLILGESGTGKEVVAQSLHYHGPRATQPFVAVNCAALTETLLESELFGHEKGAFTDANETRPGKFEMADAGTLFLDEIGDMSLGGQAKLLRVLEQKVITRVGGSRLIPINVRIVAATNTDLMEAVRQRKFREDLYYRLSVVTQMLPPLRDRPEDILVLAEHFLKQFCMQARRPALALSPEARRRLQEHSWPGNVRELRNLMERVAFLTTGNKVEADELAFILNPGHRNAPEPTGTGIAADQGLKEATRLFQQQYIREAIAHQDGNMSHAAQSLGLHRSNLYRKMRQLGMEEAELEE